MVVSTGTQPAISGETIVISGNTEVSANSSITADKVLTITDQAVVTAQDTLYGDEGIDILEQADVTVTSSTAGINAFRGPINIDGTVTILSTGAGNGAITAGQDDPDRDLCGHHPRHSDALRLQWNPELRRRGCCNRRWHGKSTVLFGCISRYRARGIPPPEVL